MLLNKTILLATSAISATPLILLSYTKNEAKLVNIIVNYNGQADLLLSLQIPPDYYPYQFKQQALYDYLKQTSDYIVANEHVSEDKQKIANALPNRLQALTEQIKKFGPGLWNKDLYDSGAVYRNDQFWSSMKTNYLLLEQFIVDDYMDIFSAVDLLPEHKKMMITNFRIARDPYSTFGKDTFEYFEKKKKKTSISPTPETDTFHEKFHQYYESYKQKSRNSLYRFGKFIDYWNENMKVDGHDDIQKKFFTIHNNNENLFNLENEQFNNKLAELYAGEIFTQDEKEELNSWDSSNNWASNYLAELAKKTASSRNKRSISFPLLHHPALEHQTVKGSSPLSEGSHKDVMAYLYQHANILKNIASDTTTFDANFKYDKRKDFVSNAMTNATEIASNYQARIKDIREYFKKLKVIDTNFDPEKKCFQTTNSKSLAIVTHSPNQLGAGNSSIQTISKFPFIYRDLGFQQVIPESLKESVSGPQKANIEDHGYAEELLSDAFSVDDNGWWWNIGNTNLNTNNLQQFKDTADSIIFLATEDDWGLLSAGNDRQLSALTSIYKKSLNFKYDYSKINNQKYPFSFSKYHLWNEGLRSPIAINLLLDTFVDIIRKQYDDAAIQHIKEYKKAQDWGNYWSDHFINGTSATAPTTKP